MASAAIWLSSVFFVPPPTMCRRAIVLAGDRGDFFDRLVVEHGQAFERAAHDFARVLRRGLAGLAAVGSDLLGHAAGLAEARRGGVDEALQRRGFLGQARELLVAVLLCPPWPIRAGIPGRPTGR